MSIAYYSQLDRSNLHTFIFDEKEIEGFVITVSDEKYSLCDKTSIGDNYWANSKKGAYGKGLGRTKSDPYKPVRTGLLGQMAVGELLGLPTDLKYREKGDKYDFLLGKYKVDVKCAMRDYGKGLIYHTNQWGKQIPLDKDIYIFSFVQEEDRHAQIAKVAVVGFASQKDVLKCPVKPGIKGNGHLNIEVDFSNLRPIQTLIRLNVLIGFTENVSV